MRYALLALAALLAFLFGCTGSFPPQCSQVPQERLANCIYVSAVLEQNPYYCYSIANEAQRSTCLSDASDPGMQKELERASKAVRDSIFAPKQEQPQTPAQPQTPSGQNASGGQGGAGAFGQGGASGCVSENPAERDSCLVAYAISSKEVGHCGIVSSKSGREACITQVAKSTKNLSACESLPLQSDFELCRSYSRGGVQ